MKLHKLLISFFTVVALSASAQGMAASNYQSRLNDNGSPPNGINDFQFAVGDSLTNGNRGTGPNASRYLPASTNVDSSWLSAPNTNIVRVNMAMTNEPITATWMHGTEFHSINWGNVSRIRQNGTIDHLNFTLSAPFPTITNLFFEVWRLQTNSPYLFNRIYREDILSKCVLGSNYVVLATNMVCQVNDFIGYGWKASADTSNRVFECDCPSIYPNSYYTTIDPGTFCNWPTNSFSCGMFAIYVYMQAPVACFLGDSTVQGNPASQSYVKWQPSYTNYPGGTFPFVAAAALGGISYQNLGVNAQKIRETYNTATNFGVAADARVWFLETGLNDLIQNTSQSAYLNAVTNILNAAASNHTQVVWIKTFPWSDGTPEQMTNRDLWNSAMQAAALLYSNTLAVVDVSSYIGQYRSNGPPGNLWDIATGLSPDGIHYYPAGYQIIGRGVVMEMKKVNVCRAGTPTPN